MILKSKYSSKLFGDLILGINLALYLVFFTSNLQAQIGIPKVLLNKEKGLSDNSVTGFAIDNLGRTWIASKSGLNVFDGVRNHRYPKQGDQWESKDIEQISFDHKNNLLFILFQNGTFSRLNPYSGTLNRMALPERLQIKCISKGNENQLIGTSNGIWENNADTVSQIRNTKNWDVNFLRYLSEIDRWFVGTSEGIVIGSIDDDSFDLENQWKNSGADIYSVGLIDDDVYFTVKGLEVLFKNIKNRAKTTSK